jgi:hypothetical protein
MAPGDRIPIAIVVGDKEATGVQVVQPAVVEQTRKLAWASQGVELCAAPTGTCSPLDPKGHLEAGSSTKLWLNAPNAPHAGHFVGPVSISSSLKPDGETINLDFYVTTGVQQLLGAGAILLGVVSAWSITGWSRTRFNRDQLLMPAALLRERLDGIAATLGQAPSALTGAAQRTSAQVAAQRTLIEDSALERNSYVPSGMPAAFGVTSRVDDYKKLLQGVDDWSVALRTLVDGMQSAWRQLSAAPSQPEVQAVAAAITSLDGLAVGNTAPALPTVQAQVVAAKTALQAALAALAHAPPGGAPQLVGVPPASRSVDQLQVEIRRLSVFAWAATGVVTTLLGTYIVVLQNLGFGIGTDYLVCLFWGLGLPAGATLLQQSAQSVATSFGVSIAK